MLFPYIHVLKIFPNTEMEEFALKNGVRKEDIQKSVGLAYHELPETLPFSKSFARQYQSRFLNEYFLNPARLKKVLPVQTIDETALIQKYNAYLPTEVTDLHEVLDFAGIEDFKLPEIEKEQPVPQLFTQKRSNKVVKGRAKKILLLDLSQHFSDHSDMLYNVSEQPLGLIYLMTYLNKEFGDQIDGRIYKSGIDFDSFAELKTLINEYQPDLIGIRTLSFYREFFHQTVSLIRDWGIDVPLISGGPYATSEYKTILQDKNIDLVVIGEGEYIFAELVDDMLENDFQLPSNSRLEKMEGIAYRDNENIPDKGRQVILVDQLKDELGEEDSSNLNLDINGDNLAYIMYTSGTTGSPKGIMVEHRQVNNCIFWMQEEFELDQDSIIVQRTNLTFDPSVWEIFWPLYQGGQVKLLSTDQSKDADYLLDLLIRKRI